MGVTSMRSHEITAHLLLSGLIAAQGIVADLRSSSPSRMVQAELRSVVGIIGSVGYLPLMQGFLMLSCQIAGHVWRSVG